MSVQKKVAAIHDISCVGRCSLTVALPIISALGIETSILPTAVLSTHTGGFEGFTYRDLTEDIKPIYEHWKSLGLTFDALYSGFLGSFAQIDLVAQMFDEFKTKDNVILVDPVCADNGVLYAIYSKEMVKGMAKLCSKADIIIPNITEAVFMLEKEYKEGPYTKEYIEDILHSLAKLGPKKVVLTGVWFDNDKLGAAAYDNGVISYSLMDRIEGYYHGTGDVFGSSLLAAYMSGLSLEESTKVAVEYTHLCIRMTADADLERRYGVCFEKALPWLIERLSVSERL